MTSHLKGFNIFYLEVFVVVVKCLAREVEHSAGNYLNKEDAVGSNNSDDNMFPVIRGNEKLYYWGFFVIINVALYTLKEN